MKTFLCQPLVFTLMFIGLNAKAESLNQGLLIREKNPGFSINLKELREGKIQYFYEMLDPKQMPLEDDQSFNETHGTSEALLAFKAIDFSPPLDSSLEKEPVFTGVLSLRPDDSHRTRPSGRKANQS